MHPAQDNLDKSTQLALKAEEPKASLTPVTGGDFKGVTRDQQLRLKSTKKTTRRDKIAKGKAAKTKRKGRKATKRTKKAGKRNEKEEDKGSTKGISRKRKILKQEAKTSAPATIPDEPPRKRKQEKLPSASSKVEPSTPACKRLAMKKSRADTEDLQTTPDAPAPKARAKAKAKAKAAVKDNGKTRVKGNKGENKAGPKAKAKAKGRAKKQKDDGYLDRQRDSMHFDAKLAVEFEDFARAFHPGMDVKSAEFKQRARQMIPELKGLRLNLYWTRFSVGLLSFESGRDVGNFSFNTSSAPCAHRMVVALKCALALAS